MRQEEIGSRIKLHIDELHDLYCLPSIIWVNKSRKVEGSGMWNAWWGEGKKNAYNILVVKPQGKSPPTPLPLPKYNNAVIAVKWNIYLRFHIRLISAFCKNKHVAYISPKFQHTFHVPTMNGDNVTPTSEVQMDKKMVLLISNYNHDSGVAPSGITQKSQHS
jgi:hypothetical protein